MQFHCIFHILKHKGMTGKVVLDYNGDREPDYWITDMVPNGTFIKIAEVLNGDVGKRVCIYIHFMWHK